MKNHAHSIAIYSRKSKFTGKGESIGNQVELCRQYIRTHYDDAAADRAVVFEDEGFSGSNVNRPAFQAMMERIEQKEFHALIVYRLDRVSRNVSDFSQLIDALSRKDIVFVSIREQFDTATPMGRAMMYIASVFAQLERETIAERIRDNMHELAKTGRWLGGNTPTGYGSESVQTVTVDGKTKNACQLKLIPEEAAVVKTVFDLFIQTGSLTQTEAELIRRGILTKNGHHFTRFSVKAILQNPVYMIADENAYAFFRRHDADLFSPKDSFDGVHGMIAYNRTDQKPGKTTVIHPVSDWIVSVGKHEGMIPGKVWAGVQDNLERNKSTSFRRPRSNEALLTGLLFCSCGSRMYPKLSKRQTDDGDAVYTYVCQMKERSKKGLCNRRNVNGNTLDLAIVEQLGRLADDTSTFIRQLEISKAFYTGTHEPYERQLSALRQQRTALEKQIAALVDTVAAVKEDAAKKAIFTRISQLQAETEAATQRIAALASVTAEHTFSDVELDAHKHLLTVCKNGMEDMSCEQQRAAVHSIVRRVVWDGEKAHVILFGADGDAEGSPIAPYIQDRVVREPLARFSGILSDEDNEGGACSSETHWREDSQ